MMGEVIWQQIKNFERNSLGHMEMTVIHDAAEIGVLNRTLPKKAEPNHLVEPIYNFE